MALSLLCPSMAKKARELTGVSLIRAQILFIRALLPSPDHLPKTPFFIPSPRGWAFTIGIGGTHIQSIINAFPGMSPYCREGYRVPICRLSRVISVSLASEHASPTLYHLVNDTPPLPPPARSQVFFSAYFQPFLIVPAAGNLLPKASGVHPPITRAHCALMFERAIRGPKVPSHKTYSVFQGGGGETTVRCVYSICV